MVKHFFSSLLTFAIFSHPSSEHRHHFSRSCSSVCRIHNFPLVFSHILYCIYRQMAETPALILPAPLPLPSYVASSDPPDLTLQAPCGLGKDTKTHYSDYSPLIQLYLFDLVSSQYCYKPSRIMLWAFLHRDVAVCF